MATSTWSGTPEEFRPSWARRPTWADSVDAAERAEAALKDRGFLAGAWKVIRGLGVAIVSALAVAGPVCANVAQMFGSAAW